MIPEKVPGMSHPSDIPLTGRRLALPLPLHDLDLLIRQPIQLSYLSNKRRFVSVKPPALMR